jgi:hypothetical protein
MDEIRERLANPIVLAALAFLVGLLFGWFVMGWGIWPVKWVDAGPSEMEATWRVDYLRMAINAYATSGNGDLAIIRWNALEDTASDMLEAVERDPQSVSTEAIDNFTQAVGGVTVPEGGGGEPQATQPAEGEDQAGDEGEEGGGTLSIILLVCGVLSVALVGIVVYFYVIRGRSRFSESVSPASQAQEYTRQAEPTDFAARGETPPMTQFMTTYMMGDDLFDDSFSIDSPTGDFLGECGIGISESIGVGEPKKVAAFEVWLFDKNDIQTVTKVLMSEHAYSDNTLRERLEKKGEPFLAEPGAEMILETATLRLVARVVDMAYGSSAAPQRSFFDRLTLELAIWQK